MRHLDQQAINNDKIELHHLSEDLIIEHIKGEVSNQDYDKYVSVIYGRLGHLNDLERCL